MDLEEVWQSVNPTEDEHTDTYVDAMGNEQSERMAAFPPPSMREGGNSSANSHRLEIHTGQFKRAKKNGESIIAEFDHDMERPAKLLNKEATERIQNVVSKNREGVQVNPDNEAQQTNRSELYNGYNVSLSTLSRNPKVQTVTNRSAQEMFVYGPEIQGDEHRSLRPESRKALKAGMFEGEGMVSQGRSSALFKVNTHRTDLKHTFLGGGDMFKTQTPGQGKVSEIAGERLSQSIRTTQYQMPQAPIRKLVTSTDVQGYAKRANIALNGKNDILNDQGSRQDGNERATTLRASGQIGSDSVVARDAYKKISFSQSAALAEHFMGSSDSIMARDAFSLQPDFNGVVQKADIIHARRSDDRRPLSPSLQQQGDHAARRSSRGRDSRNDSRYAARLGISDNRGLNIEAGTISHSRRGPNDAIHSLNGAFGRGKEHDYIHARDPTLHLNSNKDEDVFNVNKRTTSNTIFSAITGSISKLLRRQDTTEFVQQRSREPGVTTYIPHTQSARRLIDDSITQSHPPPSGGPILNSHAPQKEFLNDRKETRTVMRAGVFATGPIQKPNLSYNGHQQ